MYAQGRNGWWVPRDPVPPTVSRGRPGRRVEGPQTGVDVTAVEEVHREVRVVWARDRLDEVGTGTSSVTPGTTRLYPEHRVSLRVFTTDPVTSPAGFSRKSRVSRPGADHTPRLRRRTPTVSPTTQDTRGHTWVSPKSHVPQAPRDRPRSLRPGDQYSYSSTFECPRGPWTGSDRARPGRRDTGHLDVGTRRRADLPKWSVFPGRGRHTHDPGRGSRGKEGTTGRVRKPVSGEQVAEVLPPRRITRVGVETGARGPDERRTTHP